MATLRAGKLHAAEGGTSTSLPAFEDATPGRFVEVLPQQLQPCLDTSQISALQPGNQKQMEMPDAKFFTHKTPLIFFSRNIESSPKKSLKCL